MAGLAIGSVYALSGVGLVVLYRATGVLNLAYGIMGATSALISWQLVQWGGFAPLCWIAGVAAAGAISLFYGLLVSPLLDKREPVIKAMATLGVLLILLGTLYSVWPANPRRMELPSDAIAFRVYGVRVTLTRLIAFVGTLLLTASVVILLTRTRIGLMMRALASQRQLSAIVGIRVIRVEVLAWLISGIIAGISGILLGALVRLDAATLTFLIIPALAAAIVGRLQSLWVTVAAGMIIGMLESLATLSPALAPYRSAMPFVIAVLAIFWLQRHNRLLFANHQ
ncbi:branched-chain amino acid transporter permease subunit LivH [compost metagenome]